MAIMRKWVRALKFKTISLLRMRNGAHQVALGAVVGFFPCWFPTFGVGPALSILLTRIVKGSIPAAVIAASFGSFAWPLLFFLNYQAGRIMNRWPEESLSIPPPELFEDVELPAEYEQPVEELQTWGQTGYEFLLGSIVNSIVFTIVGYALVWLIMKRYRLAMLRMLRSKPGRRTSILQANGTSPDGQG